MTTPPGKPSEPPANLAETVGPASDPPEDATPPEGTADAADPFASFEEPMEAEATRIDTDQMLVEQPTSVVKGTARARPPFLRVTSGVDEGKEFVLADGDTGIGRAIENDIILTDISVSRQHLTIHFDGARIELRDLGSGNGTVLNGRKVHQASLAEGDRIEIGETVLTVKVPSPLLPKARPRPGDPPQPTASDPDTAAVTPELLAPAPPADVPTGAPRGRRTVSVSRRTLMLLGVAALLLVAALGALGVFLSLRSGDPSDLTSGRASERMAEMGKEAFAAGRWSEAEQAFQEVLTVRSTDTVAQSYLERIREVREHQEYVQTARAALQSNDPKKAMVQAAAVPETSPLYAEANAVRLAAQTRLMSNFDGLIRDALDNRDFERARTLLEEAQSIEPDSEAVQRIARTIAEGEERVAGRGSSPRGGGEHVVSSRAAEVSQTRQRVVKVYKRAAFDDAVQIARAAADASPASGRPSFVRLADQITRFATAYRAVERAGQDLSSVMEEAQRAITLDTQISGGHFAHGLRRRLASAQVRAAEVAIARGDMVAGCRNVRFVLQSDSSNGAARSLSGRCETAAREMLASAQRLEGTDPRRALDIYRKVTNMLLPSSESYQTAYRRLNVLARPSNVDEDE